MSQPVRDPYQSGMITTRPLILRDPVPIRTVGVLNSRRQGRGLQLIHPRTRCIRQHEVHELIVTMEPAGPGDTVDVVHYLGFFEFLQSGVLVEGDRLVLKDAVVAELAGFDDTHTPNHYNIVLRAPALKTGMDLGLRPGDAGLFVPWNLEV